MDPLLLKGVDAVREFLRDQKPNKSGKLIVNNNTLSFRPIGFSLQQICWRIAALFGFGPLSLRNISKFIATNEPLQKDLTFTEWNTLKIKFQHYNEKRFAPKKVSQLFLNKFRDLKWNAFYNKIEPKHQITDQEFDLLTNDDLKHRDAFGNTLLHFAAHVGNEVVAKKLIEKMSIESLMVPANNGSTALHDLAYLKGAPIPMFLDKFRNFARLENFLSKQDENGNTALHNAVRGNHAEAVESLLRDMGPESLAIRNKAGKTARELLSENAFINRFFQYVDAQQAIQQGKPLTDEMLKGLNDADYGKLDQSGYTLLQLAIKSENSSAAKKLVDIMPKEYLNTTSHERTALHDMLWASQVKDFPIKELIEKMDPQDLGKVDNWSATPLQYAIMAYDSAVKATPPQSENLKVLHECIELLIKKMNSEDVTRKGQWDIFDTLTPLEFVKNRGYKDLEALFIGSK